jgi:hypothetical protein
MIYQNTDNVSDQYARPSTEREHRKTTLRDELRRTAVRPLLSRAEGLYEELVLIYRDQVWQYAQQAQQRGIPDMTRLEKREE